MVKKQGGTIGKKEEKNLLLIFWALFQLNHKKTDWAHVDNALLLHDVTLLADRSCTHLLSTFTPPMQGGKFTPTERLK